MTVPTRRTGTETPTLRPRSRRAAARTRALAAVFAGATVLLSATMAGAQEAPAVYTFCYVPTSGVVYRILGPRLPDTCSSDNHLQFSFTEGLPDHSHGNLQGLDADDHAQYLLVDPETRALIADLNADGNKIVGLAAATANGEAVRFEQAVKTGDAAGGDLAGSYPNPGVAALQGNPVSDAEPSADDVLTWDGEQWVPASPDFAGAAHTHDAEDITSGVLGVPHGGTGLAAISAGDVLFGDAANSLARRAIGSNGQVLTVVSGLPAWADATSGVTDHGALDNLDADDHEQYILVDGVRAATDGFAVTGTESTGDIPAENFGTRLMWYPGKSAFRAGRISGFSTAWNDENIGRRSAAFGENTRASGLRSFATGIGTAASGQDAVAMGSGAAASGTASVALGNSTTASGQYAVAVGFSNTASGSAAFAAGFGTVASGDYSFAAGWGPTASGTASVALGRLARTNGLSDNLPRDGVFVFGDNTGSLDKIIRPTADNQFVVSATNGLRLFNSYGDGWFSSFEGGSGTGCRLSGGNLHCTGAVTSSSDAAAKTGFEPVDAEDMLNRLAAIPVQKWTYRNDVPGVRHVGPTAQDFHAAFGLGADDRSISAVDASGINMLAIQALEKRTRELDDRVAELESLRAAYRSLETAHRTLAAEHAALHDRIGELEALFLRLAAAGGAQQSHAADQN